MANSLRGPRAALVLLFALLIAAVGWLADLKTGEDLLIQRKYKEAAAALQAALPSAPADQQDRILFLLGRARHLAGDPVGAVAAFDQLGKDVPDSPLLRSAAWQKARALEKQGDARGAALIYRDEVAQLIGLSRKEEVAATYLGLADKALGVDPKDHQRAVTFFDLALDLGLLPEKSKAVRLKAAESYLALGNHAEVQNRLVPLVKELALNEGKLRAMLALGRSKRLANDRAGARTVLRDLIAAGKNQSEAGDAAYEIALSYGVPQPQPAELDRAVQALKELALNHPTHPQAKAALFLQAQCYRSVGRAEAALLAIEQFLKEQGDAVLPEIPAARAIRGDVLAAQEKFEAAIAAWRDYLRLHPSHGEWERVQRAIVDTEYGLAFGAYAEGKEKFDLARQRFATFADAYPLDARNPDILYFLGDMLLQEEKVDPARETFARCVSKYPGKEASSHAQYSIGQIFETKAFHYDNALKAYKEVTWGSYVAQAQQRIALLTRKQLGLKTERIFRTDEKGGFVLTSRNIEKVRVRVFRLDLEDYFRATHTAGDVQRLDIEVIEPDQTFDSPVPDYVRYRETTRTVPLAFDKPGAYVVKVDDKEFEATTMVLVSDLALIAKSSRHEFFVFTENAKENRPEGGVKVVLSDGTKVVAEGVTGADGTWSWKGKELQECADLRVFAVNGAGSGAGSLNLSGMGYSQGLTAKGFLFTDRPLYQPGQRVNLKGIVREVKDGLYQLPLADGYRVQVWSADGRLMLQREIKFTAFGTFAAEVDLPADAELGDWRIAVQKTGRDDLVFGGAFRVARYERPRLSLRIDLQNAVVFRGEAITGKVLANHFYGEPAAGKELVLSMRLPDGALVEKKGQTNAAGEFAFELSTTEFAEEAMAQITAVMPTENIGTATAVPVVTTEFVPTGKTVRQVYLAGEPFTVEVGIQDRSGKPLAREATAVLLRLEQRNVYKNPKVEQRIDDVEVEIERKVVKTDSKGKGSVTFACKQGGAYRVRIESKDRFGNLVTGETQVVISGDDDTVKLRLLSDQETFTVGDTAAVKVSNRAGPRLALFTWQGDGILQYETRVLPTGESMLPVLIKPEHAPNFALAVALVDGNQFHTAEREFRVLRDLRVSLQVPATSKPGSQIEVIATTLDPQGKPVAAEVAIAMVDQALLAVRPDGTPAMGTFFYGQLRETGFRTASSCTWSYEGRSQAVSGALLAEERRLRLLEDAAKAVHDGLGREGENLALKPGEPGQAATVLLVQQERAGQRRNNRAEGAPQGQVAGGRAGNHPALRGIAAEQQQEGQVMLAQTLQTGADDFFLGRTRSLAPGSAGWNASLAFDSLQAGLPFQLSTGGWVDLSGFGQGTGTFAAFVGAAAAPDQPRTDFRETGAWISSLLTGQDGKGTIKITLPDGTTGWNLKARAVTADSFVGEGEAQLKTQKELQVELVGPPVLTEGDETQLLLRAHNLTGEPLAGNAEWTAKGGADASVQQALQLAAHGEMEQSAAVTAGKSQPIEIELKARAGAFVDSLKFAIPVQPFGVEMRDGRAGSTKDKARFVLSLPAGREFGSLQMVIELGPDPGRDLLSAALGLGYQPWNCRMVETTNLARASRGLAALLVLDYLEKAGSASKADQARLLGVAQSTLTSLLSAQLPDGSLAWIGKRAFDVRSTCQSLRFLAAARARGMTAAEAALDKTAEWLQQHLKNATNEQRADVLWALATVERARFESLNSLHRARTTLDAEGLSRLALAFQAAKRPELAGEVLDVLRQKLLPGAFARTPIETVALAARALLGSDPRDLLGTQAVEFLRGARTGASWGTPEATAAAIAVLGMAQSTGAGAGKTGEARILVNGKQVAITPREATGTNSVFAVPADSLKAQGNEVVIELTGGAEIFYAASLVGFARGFQAEDRNSQLVHIERSYLAAPLRDQGREVTQGFGCVTGNGIQTWENKITQLRTGEIGRARLHFWILQDKDQKGMPPLVVVEPLPAGCSVARDSIHGNFEQVDVLPEKLVFYYREGIASDSVSYELQARFAGTYRVLPTRVQGALRPELLAYGEAGKFTVHGKDEGVRDAYRLTPDELFYLGKARFDEAQGLQGELRSKALAAAIEHFTALLGDWQKKDFYLRDDTAKEVSRMMLLASIERNDSKAIVRFFEEVKERYADLVIPFDKILAVGKAYLDLGEFEASLLVFRASADASFLKDAAVATTLEGLGEVRASSQFLLRLLQAYPDHATMRSARYGIAQKLAALAAAMDPAAPVDDKVGTAVQLRAQSMAAFREFLILHPEDPLAEEVSFAWATTCVEGKDLKQALAIGEAALQRYPGSAFTDEFLYNCGFAQFALGNHEAAFAALQRVATEDFPNERGGTGPSESKWYAVYLQGQIWHASGEPAKALEAYKQVENRFTDAGEASDYFLRKALTLAEVSTISLDKNAELAIGYRNIDKVTLQVFRVDLMRLYLLEKSLNNIRGIQLSGIKPMLTLEVKLGDGRDYKSMEKKVELELKEPGAYLVVARGGDLLATGMLLRSDLEIETQESLDQGRLRVNVKQKGLFAADAHVKVIGSQDQQFRSGETDLRGVFTADGLVGLPTVIVKNGDQYTFFRGTGVHQPVLYKHVPEPVQTKASQDKGQDEKRKDARKFDALEQNVLFNSANRGKQVEWLQKEVMNKQQKGVEVYRAK